MTVRVTVGGRKAAAQREGISARRLLVRNGEEEPLGQAVPVWRSPVFTFKRTALVGVAVLAGAAACSERKEAGRSEEAPIKSVEVDTAPEVVTGDARADGPQSGAQGGRAAEEELAAGHPHGSPHGGQTITTESGHLELVATRSGEFRLWLLDKNLRLRPVEGEVAATLRLDVPGYEELAFRPAGDHLEAKGPPIRAGHPTATVTVKTDRATETGEFELHLEGTHH